MPDIAGWRRERMPQLPHDQRLQVAPDWICEVLSPQRPLCGTAIPNARSIAPGMRPTRAPRWHRQVLAPLNGRDRQHRATRAGVSPLTHNIKLSR